MIGSPDRPALEPITLFDFLTSDFPPRELVLDPWLPAKGLALLFSPRGVGKTHVALGVGFAVATGGTFLGWKAPSARKVLLIDGEMPAEMLRDRLKDIVDRAAIPSPMNAQLRILAFDLCPIDIPDLGFAAGREAIDAVIGDADLIILDNLSTLVRSGKENEAESWGAVQHWALGHRRAGRSILFVHHAGKGGDQRGTSKREDVMDTVIKLERPEGYSDADGARFNVSFPKARGFCGREAEPFEACLREGEWHRGPLRDERAEQIRELVDRGLSQRDIANELKTSPATVNRVLKHDRSARAANGGAG